MTKRDSGSIRCVHPLADEANKGKEKEKLACHGRIGIGGKAGIWRILIAIGKIRAYRAPMCSKMSKKEKKRKKIEKKAKRSDTLKEHNLAHRTDGKRTLCKPKGWR